MKSDKEIPKEIIPLFKGKSMDLLLPSGKLVTVRECNGDDDDIISDQTNSEDGTNIHAFLSSIIIKDHDINKKPSVGEIAEWLENDIYGLLLKQRIFNHGPELKFTNTCQTPSCNKLESTYEENLKIFDADMGDHDFKPASDQLRRYPLGSTKEVEFTTSSGKKLKYSILTATLDKKSLDLTRVTKNSALLMRELHIDTKGNWVKVTHFAMFSTHEMAEIRSHIKKNDLIFDPQVTFSCPKCKTPYSVSLWRISSFFYPGEEI